MKSIRFGMRNWINNIVANAVDTYIAKNSMRIEFYDNSVHRNKGLVGTTEQFRQVPSIGQIITLGKDAEYPHASFEVKTVLLSEYGNEALIINHLNHENKKETQINQEHSQRRSH